MRLEPEMERFNAQVRLKQLLNFQVETYY